MKANRNIAKFISVLDELDRNGIRVPGMIMSHAGFGKTSTIRMYCDYMDYNLETVIPAQSSYDDFLGIQSMIDGKMVRLTPSWFNKLEKTVKNGKRTILFLDEISACDTYLQGPLLDLIFSRNLGERYLPDNVFIVAAGNYSEDLNNEFKMMDPLVNRFMILNLINSDFSLSELLDYYEDDDTSLSFNNANTKERIEKFLDLKRDKSSAYDFKKFVSWVKTSKEIGFGKTTIEETEEGLWGFTSIRSLDNSMKFVRLYMNAFNDDLWTRIVGNTLGTSKKHENMSLSTIIRSNIDLFKVDKIPTRKVKNTADNDDVSISDTLRNILNNSTITDNDIKALNNIIDTTSAGDFSTNDLRIFSELVKKFNSPELLEINNALIKKVSGFY